MYYFRRHVALDVRDQYKIKRIVFSLKTKSHLVAISATSSIAQKLEDYWMSIRLSKA